MSGDNDEASNDFLHRMESMLRNSAAGLNTVANPPSGSGNDGKDAFALFAAAVESQTPIAHRQRSEPAEVLDTGSELGSSDMECNSSSEEDGGTSEIELATHQIEEEKKTDTLLQAGEASPARLAETTSAMEGKKALKRKRELAGLMRFTGDILHTIPSASILPIATSVTWLQPPELLCCYNWQQTNDGTNAIFVPGAPPLWTSPSLPYTVPNDNGYHFVDHNHARQPKYPYAPMFCALSSMNPNVKFDDLDILADRNNFRTLLEYVQGKSTGPFRIDLHKINNTLILVKKADRFWRKANGISHGYNFESHFTQPEKGLEDATSHYRVIRYEMGPLRVAVRFEADACYQETEPREVVPTTLETVGKPDLTERPRFNFTAPIRVIRRGRLVPCANIAEIKSQSIKYDAEGRTKSVGTYPCMDQLWFGRTTHLFTGRYQSETGVFSRVNYKEARSNIADWEEKSQDGLRKLVSLLVQLKGIVEGEDFPEGAAVVLRETKTGPLTVRVMDEVRLKVHPHFVQKYWKQPLPDNRHQRRAANARGGYQRGNAHQRGSVSPHNFHPRGAFQHRGDYAARRQSTPEQGAGNNVQTLNPQDGSPNAYRGGARGGGHRRGRGRAQ
ncbi:hypothetical protein BU24DRAFT_421095 [Aaosphaeria arxii CBS 175.79]|uniref:Geranylgeranyl pyrophosphate synthetase n=1 Tax=Aaosphaeria arxii CBS 175.79 TaxID=1450172 RepID=A0A6A5XY45_9PLEO|nr:uncharacterized protein BU24DRAFT_421095 [Aaosphaeria arxii CBS 175.79]KAF2018082.1 hypothetical protein BU24DRAFT_421095 [Aaosphaeria arxii CBS 175.79]